MAEESTVGERPKGASRVYEWLLYRALPTAVALFVGFLLMGLGLSFAEKDSTAYDWVGWIGFIGTLAAGSVTWVALDPNRGEEGASRQRVRDAERDFEDALRGRRISTQVDPGEGHDPPPELLGQAEPVQGFRARHLALPELWAVTHTRLDHYHEIALGQARQSFRNAQVAMGLGFSLLVAFVLVALNASTTTGAVVAGGLGAVSAALAGYVSRTFVLSQQAAASHLRVYFDQPLEFARYLAAERIVMDAGLDQAQRAEVLTTLVQSIVANPLGAAPDQGQSSTGP
ncbi:TRADD-N-associated membrane domain-containing protein [Streptomyces sp. NPDC054962]